MNQYFAATMTYDKPEPKHRLCLQSGAVTLQQQGANGRFLVRYGKQVKAGLSYAEAASEFGACLMHQAACDGLLGNEGP